MELYNKLICIQTSHGLRGHFIAFPSPSSANFLVSALSPIASSPSHPLPPNARNTGQSHGTCERLGLGAVHGSHPGSSPTTASTPAPPTPSTPTAPSRSSTRPEPTAATGASSKARRTRPNRAATRSGSTCLPSCRSYPPPVITGFSLSTVITSLL